MCPMMTEAAMTALPWTAAAGALGLLAVLAALAAAGARPDVGAALATGWVALGQAPGGPGERERAARLELALLRTRRELGELREQVAWQSRLLARPTDPPGAEGPAARAEQPAG